MIILKLPMILSIFITSILAQISPDNFYAKKFNKFKKTKNIKQLAMFIIENDFCTTCRQWCIQGGG
jgi:hypothetical protein